MTPFPTHDFDARRPLGETGFLCSGLGVGTGSCRLSDWAQSSSPTPAAVWEFACRQNVNLFDLGCAACQPQQVLTHARLLADAWQTNQNSSSPLTLIRYDLRCLPATPVDLQYQLLAHSVDSIVEQIQQNLGDFWNKLSLTGIVGSNIAWIWDGIDLAPSAARPLWRQRNQLLEQLLNRNEARCWKGLGGFSWQNLAEMTGRFRLDLIMIHAAFGLLGPALDDSLVPTCRRHGIGILTTLPFYGGLITAPHQLAADHPATEDEVKAAHAACLMAEEFEVDLAQLAVQTVRDDSGPDCLLLELPNVAIAQQLLHDTSQPMNARKQAIITRHYHAIKRTEWWAEPRHS